MVLERLQQSPALGFRHAFDVGRAVEIEEEGRALR
jgi:hypothetical protein